ncbi:MAG: hypothetical protein V8R52_06590 [Coprobacter fastidiosus]
MTDRSCKKLFAFICWNVAASGSTRFDNRGIGRNDSGWELGDTHSLKLTVIPVKGWQHGDSYILPVKPSPNLPNSRSITLYPSLCFFEATDISVGRGTRYPFQVLGYPDKKFGTFSFTPRALPGFDRIDYRKIRLVSESIYGKFQVSGGLSF